MSKFVYFFAPSQAEGNKDMKDLLGGKGANLAEMAGAGLPVPPGFTVTTEVCTLFSKSGGTSSRPRSRTEIQASLRKLEAVVGQDVRRPRRTRSSSPSARAPSSRCPG